MSNRTAEGGQAKIDLSELDARMGQLVGGGQLWEPCQAIDIRRWVVTTSCRLVSGKFVTNELQISGGS